MEWRIEPARLRSDEAAINVKTQGITPNQRVERQSVVNRDYAWMAIVI
jgi:hypothetical protein